jgi:uncharacterized protein YgbK (DUF1537 family)
VTARIGFLADDLTGAADVLAQAHALGLDAALTLDPRRLPDAEVVGVAGPARSLEGQALDQAIREGLAPFLAADLDVLLYKICSTFDSSPTVGNIARGIEILNELWPEHGAIPVAPAQPEFGRYTAFSQHFGALNGEVYRLDRHPVMSRHPSTPMTESDLRLVLAAQSQEGAVPGAIALTAYSDGSFLDQWRAQRADQGSFVLDAVTAGDMDMIAAALTSTEELSIVVGSGGMMAALARLRGTPATAASGPSSARGPALAVSASASSTTADQIAHAIGDGWVEVEVPPEAFGSDEPRGKWFDEVAGALADGRNVVAHTLRGMDDPRLHVRAVSSEEVGGAIGRIAREMTERRLTQDVAVFGGDSSSHALITLGVSELRVAEQFVTAGPICAADDASAVAGCRLLLKGGQVGPIDILRRFAGVDTSKKETA